MTYINSVKTCINDCKQRYQNLANKGLLWDTIKTEIRGISISFASYSAKNNNKQEEKLFEKLV